MSANTILLDFSVDLTKVDIKDLEDQIVEALEVKENFGPGSLESVVTRKELNTSSCDVINCGSISVLSGPRGSIVTIRVYGRNDLVTINIDYYLADGESPLLTLQDCRNLETAWSSWSKKTKCVKTLAAIRRGIPFDTYFYSSVGKNEMKCSGATNHFHSVDVFLNVDERLLEYDIDSILYDERSQFQHIQVFHSLNFGNMLVLDDLQNLAESDLIYTQSIMCHGVEKYGEKDILILGGGDGALLYELRKENPSMVTMVEIDDMVMQACRVHLRSACGDTLDNYRGHDYEIIVGDCLEFMTRCVSDGKKFDYVFGDLTDIPLGPSQDKVWDFIRNVVNLSFKILKPNGKYMTHGDGSSSPAALQHYENLLEESSLDFIKTHAFVPSFLEDWVFYQVKRKSSSQSNSDSKITQSSI